MGLAATVLFTDIVGSTERAGALGDREWKALLDLHDEISRRVVQAHDGRLVETTGDEILATFDGPGRAIQCAAELGRELERVGLPIRSGLHVGEVERRGNRIGGMAVHIAARVRSAAGSGEVLVSRTVRDLVVGSDIAFEDRGVHELKGVDGEWQLYAPPPTDTSGEPHSVLPRILAPRPTVPVCCPEGRLLHLISEGEAPSNRLPRMTGQETGRPAAGLGGDGRLLAAIPVRDLRGIQ